LSGFNEQRTSVDFNGTNEYMADRTEQLKGYGAEWSMAFWCKPAAGSYTQRSEIMVVRQLGAAPSDRRYRRNLSLRGEVANDPFSVETYRGSGGVTKRYTWDGLLVQDAWNFVVVTRTAIPAATITLYKSGVEMAPDGKAVDGNGTMADSARAVFIGSGGEGLSFFTGRIHSTGIWGSLLSEAEALALFNGGDGRGFDWSSNSGNYISAANLQHWWRLGRDDMDMGADSGNYALLADVDNDSVNITLDDIVLDSPGITAAAGQTVTFQDNDDNTIFTLDALNGDSSEFVGDWVCENGLWVAGGTNEGLVVSAIYSQDGA
jgi:hypothetical protein